MNSPQLETNMTSNVVFSFRYNIASIQASGWGGSSRVAGLAATAIVVLLFDAATSALSSKRRRVRSPKVSEAEGGAIGGTDEVSVAWGRVTRAVGISLSSYLFWYSSRSISFEALRCTAKWSLYNSMPTTEHW